MLGSYPKKVRAKTALHKKGLYLNEKFFYVLLGADNQKGSFLRLKGLFLKVFSRAYFD